MFSLASMPTRQQAGDSAIFRIFCPYGYYVSEEDQRTLYPFNFNHTPLGQLESAVCTPPPGSDAGTVLYPAQISAGGSLAGVGRVYLYDRYSDPKSSSEHMHRYLARKKLIEEQPAVVVRGRWGPQEVVVDALRYYGRVVFECPFCHNTYKKDGEARRGSKHLWHGYQDTDITATEIIRDAVCQHYMRSCSLPFRLRIQPSQLFDGGAELCCYLTVACDAPVAII